MFLIFQMILTQFRDVLSNHGITCYHSTGKAFDPHLHEAVEMEETDSAEEGTVIRESRRSIACLNRGWRFLEKEARRNQEGGVTDEQF